MLTHPDRCPCEPCCDVRERSARRAFVQPINPDPARSIALAGRTKPKAPEA